MIRAPAECVKAVLANLEMAAQAQANCAKKASGDWAAHTHHIGQRDAYRDAINLIQTECADILKETK